MKHKKSILRSGLALTVLTFVLMFVPSSWAKDARRTDPTNLLVNPGFETGDFTGWTVSGNSPNYGVNISGFLITGTDDMFGPTTVIVHSGTFAGYAVVCLTCEAFYQPDYLELSQAVNVTPGSQYSVGLWVGDGSSHGYGDSIFISVDGIPIMLTSDPDINPGYQFVGGSFVASDPNPTILFHIEGSGSGRAGFSFDDFLLTVGTFSFNNSYSLQTLIYPGDTFTQTLGINNASTIAGYHGSGAVGQPNQGFVLTLPNNFSSENFPDSVQTQVIGINSPGSTAGFYIDQAGTTHGFLDIGGTFSTVDFPGTTFNQLLGLNDSNEAAGYWQDDSGTQFPYTVQGGVFTLLDSNLPSNTSAQATGVNNAGMVSGFYVDASEIDHGFLLDGATLTTLNYPGATFTQALGLNNRGQVVGAYVDSGGATHGFVYTVSSQGFQSVDDPFGVGTTVINGINDLGQIVGFFVDATGNTDGFLGTPSSVVIQR